jgi:hypothetical protein
MNHACAVLPPSSIVVFWLVEFTAEVEFSGPTVVVQKTHIPKGFAAFNVKCVKKCPLMVRILYGVFLIHDDSTRGFLLRTPNFEFTSYPYTVSMTN